MIIPRPVGETLQKVLMVPPDHFGIEYKINPWMGGIVDKDKAYEQWNTLKKGVEDAGIEVELMNGVQSLPDMVFVCNSGLVYKDENNTKKIYLAKFRNSERRGEEPYYAKFFKDMGLEIWGEGNNEAFEGGGDCFFTTYKTLFAGYGPRSDKHAYTKLQQMGDFEVVYCELVSPWFYHIDTCMCPLDETTLLWYPPALSQSSQAEIRQRMPNSIEISEAEAHKFVCNSIRIRKTILSPVGMLDTTKRKLEDRGYTIKEFDMSEFMKSGGACKCCILKLW